jgi:ribosome-binding protein aMBF1 (putative translation factor)
MSNIINDTCTRYGLTKEELANKIGASASVVRNSASSGKISDKTRVAIELFIENQELKEEVKDFNSLKQIFSKILK